MLRTLLLVLVLTPATFAADYAIVVKQATLDDAAWKPVIDALVKKHDGVVIAYAAEVTESREALAKMMPRYTCFVTKPEEAGRAMVIAVHRMTRALDDDPYTDTRWAILTGYSPDAALRIAQASEPLVIRKGAAGTPMDLSPFHEGVWYSERDAGEYVVKKPGEKAEKQTGPADSTAEIVDTLNKFSPDLFMTSGHATERDWQIGYAYRNGQFRCADGKLFGLDTAGQRLPIDSPNPKIYMPVGNCLMGHIADRDSMALAFMNNAGVNQMIGYTVLTWFGKAGWGTRDYLFDLPGRYSLSDAFFFNNQMITRELIDRFPKSLDYVNTHWDLQHDPRALARIAGELGYTQFDQTTQQNVGLIWDRDTLALYGDPAWDARLDAADLPVKTQLSRDGNTWTYTMTATRNIQPARPLADFLPQRVKNVKLTTGAEFAPVITDDFILLEKTPVLEAGKTYTVTFTADPIE
ncbi:MAG: hypothetical protein GC162_13460 [Planctomycetes bacterium]|nr:hypothetical protein [Planctomycetota bacterium]